MQMFPIMSSTKIAKTVQPNKMAALAEYWIYLLAQIQNYIC